MGPIQIYFPFHKFKSIENEERILRKNYNNVTAVNRIESQVAKLEQRPVHQWKSTETRTLLENLPENGSWNASKLSQTIEWVGVRWIQRILSVGNAPLYTDDTINVTGFSGHNRRQLLRFPRSFNRQQLSDGPLSLLWKHFPLTTFFFFIFDRRCCFFIRAAFAIILSSLILAEYPPARREFKTNIYHFLPSIKKHDSITRQEKGITWKKKKYP